MDLHRPRDEKEAEAAAAAQVVALQGGTFVDPSKETVEEFVHRWLRDHVDPSLALRTQRRQREIVEHDLVPFIGKVPLQKLRPSHVIAVEQRLRASVNPKTGAGLGLRWPSPGGRAADSASSSPEKLGSNSLRENPR